MALLDYAVHDRVLVGETLFEVTERGVNRFGGPNYRLVPIGGEPGTRPRWLTPRRNGARASVVDRHGLRALVYGFYDRVRADPELAAVFEPRLGDHWPEHLERMVCFWSSVMLAEGSFHGNPMPKHQALHDATPEHFVRWLGIFDETVDVLFEPPAGRALRDRALRMARGLSTGRFGRPFDAAA